VKGFTLIELLVTISIMGILAGGVAIAINPADKINAANDAKVKADLASLTSAMQTFTASNGGLYPDLNSPPLLSSGCASGNATTVLGGTGGLVANKEIGSIPIPPSGYGTSYSYCWDNSATPPKAKIAGNQKKGGTTVIAWCSWMNAVISGASYTLSLNTCP
jgi:prepilin-type N-terminal cleavage/methylation domain-containing protein